MKFNKKKIITSLLVAVMLHGMSTSNIINANEVEDINDETMVGESSVINAPEESEVTTGIMPTYETMGVMPMAVNAPADWAFTAESKPLHDAIIEKYPDVDNDNDGYISISEANNYLPATINGLGEHALAINNTTTTGGVDGIQYFTHPTLKQITLGSNQLTGEIPANIDNLSNIKRLQFNNNNMSGEIPASLGNLTGLDFLEVNNNNFSGEIPSEIANLSTIRVLNFANNPNLTGDLYAMHPAGALVNVWINNTAMIQTPKEIAIQKYTTILMWESDNLAENLLSEDALHLVDGVSQEDIDKAQETANTFPEGTIKEEWQANINKAQELYAEKVVDDLFGEEGKIKDEVTQADIDNAEDLVNKLVDGDLKDELEEKLKDAQNQLDEREAQKAVDDLFDEEGKVKDEVTQADIDNAEDLVNKLVDGDKKDELLDKLKEAQKQLEERNFVVLKNFAVFKGKGTVYTKIDAPVEKFSAVYVNGTLVSPSNYTVESGSTVVTLNEAYLQTLANGTYNVEVEFVSGARITSSLIVDVTTNKPSINPTYNTPSTTSGTIQSQMNVNTGDETNATVLYALLAISLLSIVVIAKKKKEQTEK